MMASQGKWIKLEREVKRNQTQKDKNRMFFLMQNLDFFIYLYATWEQGRKGQGWEQERVVGEEGVCEQRTWFAPVEMS